ncbi:MAG: flagellar hook protein FlgE [Bacillales bacterium]|jgi:flagellar hook protein FlgE|nr:flagellar hook protein FlgE [Bacillales bacterium]
MLKSLYSGVSGMKGFQTKLDVIGNNIANVNTVGFKKSRVMFQDIINQNISGATAPTAQSGGINVRQVGLGTKIASIDTMHTPGSPMSTNLGRDLAIEGDAYFMVSPDATGQNQFLTKAGNFDLDANGNFVNSNGYFVQGIADGVTVPINISNDGITNAKFTSFSIDSNGYINVVDENGNSGKLAYDGTDYYLNDGLTPATLNEQISLATAVVTNPGGLKKVGNTMFAGTGNSGVVTADRIQNNSGGQIAAGILEMSNVDLTEEFTEMIVAQRGFQANARTITTSDSILEEVVNLKR